MQAKKLNPLAVEQLEKLHQVMNVGNYSPKSILNYAREMRFIFQHYPAHAPHEITADMILKYICDTKAQCNSGHSKCRMMAHSVKFFFTHVLNQPYSVPSKLYPRKEYRLLNVMTMEEVALLFSVIKNPKHKCIIELFYGSGLRLSEMKNLKIADIDSKQMRIKINFGKGRKDRYTLLSPKQLSHLREYYLQYKPQFYLFEGSLKAQPMHERAIQHLIQNAMIKAGLGNKKYNSITFRHKCLEPGCSVNTDYNAKELRFYFHSSLFLSFCVYSAKC
jgi:site-specific recombinase XerD